MSTLKQLQEKARRARERFESEQAKLYRGDGSKRYSEEEHNERLRHLRAQRNAELDQIEAAVEQERQEAAGRLQALEDGDPTAWLNREELERATARQSLIAADVASLDRDSLRQRLSGVKASKDRGSQLAYYLAARGAKLAQDPATRQILGELREAIIPDSHRQKVQEARSAMRQTGEVREIAQLARREQSSYYVPNYAVPGPQRAG